MPPDTLGVELILLQPIDRLSVMPYACVSDTTKENKDSEITQDKIDTTTRQIAKTMYSQEIGSGFHKDSARRGSTGTNLKIFSLALFRLSYAASLVALRMWHMKRNSDASGQ